MRNHKYTYTVFSSDSLSSILVLRKTVPQSVGKCPDVIMAFLTRLCFAVRTAKKCVKYISKFQQQTTRMKSKKEEEEFENNDSDD